MLMPIGIYLLQIEPLVLDDSMLHYSLLKKISLQNKSRLLYLGQVLPSNDVFTFDEPDCTKNVPEDY